MNLQNIKKLSYLIILFGSLIISSCSDYLEVPPKNVITNDDVFANSASMTVYLSRMYSQMPYEDFKYSPARQFFDDWLVTPGTNEGSSIGRDAGAAMISEGWARNGAYWTRAFELLRDVNRLIESLPSYRQNFSEDEYNYFMGEGYYSRAMVFYALAKRYGGIPLITKMLNYPEQPISELEIPRSTEAETWDQILSDFDKAIELLPDNSRLKGGSNKYVALSFKSEAMLYAGSIAKYNNITGFGDKTGVRVIGFDPNTSIEASNKYFTEAYNSSKEVIKSGKYTLYLNKWSANDRNAQYQNLVDMFFDVGSKENILIKQYSYPDLTHGFDSYNIPRQLMGGNGYSSGNCPTLDFVELFDDFDKNADGTIKVFDGNGKYILFDNITDIFANAEPRLKANVMLPGSEFKGEIIDIRRGIFTGNTSNGIDPLRVVNGGEPDYSISGPSNYNQVDAYNAKGKFTSKQLFLSRNGSNHEVVKLPDGSNLNAAGKSGPFTADLTGAYTGFVIRKWQNPNMPQTLVLEARSEQHFILMRYAEVLLNAAEAATELLIAGKQLPDGDNAVELIKDYIGQIRLRAGANPISVNEIANNDEILKIVRKERRKELAFENKILWDIRRWRTQHSDVLNGSTQADGAWYRGLYPFYSTEANAYFFDAGFEESRKRFRIGEHEYYFMIPSGEVAKSPVIDQQPGR